MKALAERYETKSPANRPAADAVRALPIFRGLSTGGMSRLIRLMPIEQVPAGRVLVREGMPQEYLYILLRGLLELFTGHGAHEATLTIVSAPAVPLAEVVVHDAAALVSVRTVQASCIGRIAVDHVRQLAVKERAFADAMAGALAENWINLLREAKNLRTRTGTQRLAAWMLAMLGHAGASHEITLPFGKRVLAARLGVAAPTLSRDLARLAPLGVTVRGRRLTIGDPERLRELTVLDELNTPPVP